MTGSRPSEHPGVPTGGTRPADHLQVLEASPNAIIAVDDAGLIVYANPRVEATFGHPPAALIGKPVELLIPERIGERHEGHRGRFLAAPHARPMGIGLDLAGRRRDGTEFPVEISLAPVRTDSGWQVYATVVDITARKSLEGQLLQAQKMESIGRLAGGIAHDFNNMLSAIRGYAELLIEDLNAAGQPDLDEVRQSVTAIHDTADRAATLTGQLLAFARQQVVTPRSLELSTEVAKLEPMLRRLIGEHVSLVMRLDPATGSIRCDPSQLDQIVMNLVVNARDALSESGTITIETGNVVFDEPYAIEHFELTPGPYVMLAISDTGQGMDHATREHIFEPFFTTKGRGQGTGLGLSTIYGIVRQSGGHIWVYSEPGQGSAFKLYFPQTDPQPTEAQPDRDDVAPASAGRVLLAEDEASVRDLTTKMLRRSGYEVFVAEDGAEALAVMERAGSIDVLVSDVVMPGMSGIDLAEAVRQRAPDVGVVLLSGYTAETLDLERMLERGAVFVAKPFTGAQLAEAVATSRAMAAADVPGRRDEHEG